MNQIKQKPSKRLDLQGIRALAIIVVLGFHFYPEYCPNGYLGVDQFMSIGASWPRNVTSFEQDSIYQTMKGQMLKFIENIKYKLYILDAIPRINRRTVNQIAQLIKNGTDPVAIDKIMVRPHGHEMARKRHAQLVKDCKGKCELVDYVPEFYKNATKTFRYFDEKGFSYFTTPEHLSPHGIEHIRHVWTDICKKL
ncbi:hypothetical protein L3Y34_006725 [Caenorhabditis briggsae]|uniref:SGNH domain-containing protein n=1 Tax=Caenorhabditis briggsae TaxID=6238 RepID=A0AAE9A043_CAEBR|nr:hypothetical protein L3Y34_006725 [Caenorhabditis briggsae]